MRPITLAALTYIVSASLAIAAPGRSAKVIGVPGKRNDKCGAGTPVLWNCQKDVCQADGKKGKDAEAKCSDTVDCCFAMIKSKANVPPRCHKSDGLLYGHDECCGILRENNRDALECQSTGRSTLP